MAKIFLNTKQVMAGFQASDMTIYTWRQGTSAARTALPFEKQGTKVVFSQTEIEAWAKKHSLLFDATAAGAALNLSSTSKTGPKPKAVVAKKAAVKKTVAKKAPAKKMPKRSSAVAAVEPRVRKAIAPQVQA